MFDAISYHPSLMSHITWKLIKKKKPFEILPSLTDVSHHLEINEEKKNLWNFLKVYLLRCFILLHFNFLFFFLSPVLGIGLLDQEYLHIVFLNRHCASCLMNNRNRKIKRKKVIVLVPSFRGVSLWFASLVPEPGVRQHAMWGLGQSKTAHRNPALRTHT